MSWPFGGRRRTYVATSVNRVIEDKLVPDITKSAIFNSVLLEESITANLNNGVMNSFALKSDRAFKYASNDYYYGLPNHSFLSDDLGRNEVLAYLNTIYDSVNIIYHHFDVINHLHIGFQYLTENYNYNQVTNILTVNGTPNYLENMVGIVNTVVTEFEDEENFNPFDENDEDIDLTEDEEQILFPEGD